jgi:DNA-binding MarR family transcriptional regulator
MSLSIGRNNPIRARLILEALASKPRLKLIRLILENDKLTASELSELTGISLSTIIEHLDLLCAAGILRWHLVKRGRRRVKQYFLSSRYIELKIDLSTLTEAIDIYEIRELLAKYIVKKIGVSRLPLKTDVRDISNTLELGNMVKAIAILDLFNYDEEYVINVLIGELDRVGEIDNIDVRDLARKLNVHEYWALRVAQKLSESGKYILKDNVLFRVD